MLKNQLHLGNKSVMAARSALSNLIDMTAPEQAGVTNHPFVARLIKGMNNVDPPNKKYNQIWSPQIVLNYIKNMPSNENLSLLALSRKTVTLAALVSGSRCQSLHKLLTVNMTETEDCFCCRLPLTLKTSKSSQREQVLHLPKYHDPQLCVFSALKEYQSRTEQLRPPSTDRFFIISMHPFNAATGGTLARWIKELMEMAGIDVSIYTTHSTRKAATSQASELSVPLGTILRAAGWASHHTFAQYYKLPVVAHTTFANAVLAPYNVRTSHQNMH